MIGYKSGGGQVEADVEESEGSDDDEWVNEINEWIHLVQSGIAISNLPTKMKWSSCLCYYIDVWRFKCSGIWIGEQILSVMVLLG
jgi:hypothetical protein